MNALELAKKHPEAFQALPIPYQNDNCLDFSLEKGYLYAQPKPDEESWLGVWVCVFLDGEWIQDDSVSYNN